jgi:hypothetical protein
MIYLWQSMYTCSLSILLRNHGHPILTIYPSIYVVPVITDHDALAFSQSFTTKISPYNLYYFTSTKQHLDTVPHNELGMGFQSGSSR